jgi:hypothetical protein
MARKKQVIDLGAYSAMDAWAIALNEWYKSLRRAGFSTDLALGIILERDSFPDWILPKLPNKIDPMPYEDDDED